MILSMSKLLLWHPQRQPIIHGHILLLVWTVWNVTSNWYDAVCLRLNLRIIRVVRHSLILLSSRTPGYSI